MKSVILAILITIPGLGYGATVCQSSDNRAELILNQVGSDVAMELRERPNDYNKYYNEKVDGDVTIQESVRFNIKNTDLATLLSKKPMLTKLVVSAVFQIGRFDGEEDMAYVYAGDYVARLKCQ